MTSEATRRVALVESSIPQLATALAAGEVRAVDLVQGYLERIAAYDRESDRNSVV